jgi:hypothetical protein
MKPTADSRKSLLNAAKASLVLADKALFALSKLIDRRSEKYITNAREHIADARDELDHIHLK